MKGLETMSTEMLQIKKNAYKERIDRIAKESFNNEQKELSKKIIENASENDIDAVYQLISQRIKTGFVFDAAPEVNHECISITMEDKELFVESNYNPAIFIEHKLVIGENYDALKNLNVAYIDHETGKGLIDVIYIDPPYNTESAKNDGNDYKDDVQANKFVYRDKFTRDGWLNMMNERLLLAKRLLSDKGVIFISIDDNEQAYLKVLCDEIFGEKAFVGVFTWVRKKKRAFLNKKIGKMTESVLLYQKQFHNAEYYGENAYEDKQQPLVKRTNSIKNLVFPAGIVKTTLKDGHYNVKDANKSTDVSFNNDFDVLNGKVITRLNTSGRYVWTQEFLDKEIALGTEINLSSKFGFNVLRNDQENKIKAPSTLINKDVNVGTNEDASEELSRIFTAEIGTTFSYAKPTSLIKYLIKMVTYNNPNAIVLDFFAGSGTTGQAVMELNEEDNGKRKFILVTNNENNIGIEITRERLLRVINGKGSRDEKIDWRFSENMPSLSNNKVRVFVIKRFELKLNDFYKAKNLIPLAENQFVLLNESFKLKSKYEIYSELSSLNPYKEGE